MYKIRDQLKKHLSKKDLQYLLESNDQEIPVGEDKVGIVLKYFQTLWKNTCIGTNQQEQ